MVKKSLSIQTNDSKIYKQILSFMNFLIGATDQEREVLAEIIRLNHEYEALPIEKRAKFVLSTDMRKEMREIVKIEDPKHFNGLIARLKDKTLFGKPLLNKNGVLHPELMFKPDGEGYKIELTLTLQNEIQQTQEITSNTNEVQEEITNGNTQTSHEENGQDSRTQDGDDETQESESILEGSIEARMKAANKSNGNFVGSNEIPNITIVGGNDQ